MLEGGESEAQRGSFWVLVIIFGCVLPAVYMTLVMLGAYVILTVLGAWGGWKLIPIAFAVIFSGLLLSLALAPIGMLVGALNALWSRHTQDDRRWVVRSVLVGVVCLSLSYTVPIGLKLDFPLWLCVLVNLVGGAGGSLVAALIAQQWRPLPVSPVVMGRQDVTPSKPVSPRGFKRLMGARKSERQRKSAVAVVFIFAIVGPIIGGIVFLLAGGIAVGAVTSFEDLRKLFAGSLVFSLIMSPLGLLQATLTGLAATWISSRVRSTWLWLIYSSLTGAILSVFSLTTILPVGFMARDYGFWGGLIRGLGLMGLAGGVAAAVCAVLCLWFRRRTARTATVTVAQA